MHNVQIGKPVSQWQPQFEADKASATNFHEFVHVDEYEPFVDEHAVARFLQIAPRRVLEMARKQEIPAHPIGSIRKTWRFRLSEVNAHFSQPAGRRSQDRSRLVC